MRPSVPEAPPLRAVGIRSFGMLHMLETGSYASTTLVLVADRMKPWPVAADDVDLAVDDAAEGVIARHRHRIAGLPLVRGGVVHVVRAEHAGGPEGGEE